MDFHKHASSSNIPSLCRKQLSIMVPENVHNEEQDRVSGRPVDTDVDIDLREVYFLIMHFLSAGPCQKGFAQLLNDLMEHQLLPRRYHAWYSRTGMCSGDENDDGVSVPLCYEKLIQRYSHVANDHLVKLLKQLILRVPHSPLGVRVSPSAADVPTLLGTGSFSLLACDQNEEKKRFKGLLPYLRWPHMQVDQVRGLNLRAIGGGFTRHHRAPSVHGACYAIAKPSTMVQRMQNIKRLRGHRNAVYCAIFDRSGRYVITGSDDRLVKIWSMETALCLASCRGHEGDITDLAVSLNNMLVASASNDFVIRVWHLPDGMPVSILQGHTGVVTTIAFSPKASYLLLSSSDDGTCRIWDARNSQCKPRIYVPKPVNAVTGRNNVPSSSTATQQTHQILCCAFNASGAIFVTGSSDTCARVWSTCKPGADDSGQPNYEIDLLSGHENDVNYVQFSGSAVMSRSAAIDALKEDHPQKFKNSWFSHDNIVTCSRDGSAIIWVAKSRRSHGKVIRWTKAYHLKVPPPPLPPQAPRGGPRRRILPTPRGVNMIVWSLDNRFVLAAIMDCRICVWNAADGSLVHSLTGHTESTYVLDVHPFNPRIAMSASYDGRTIIWDIWEGTPVKIFEIGRIKLVDGKFSPDGTSIVLSDDVGQIYFLNTGQGESQKDAKYDQFFLGDYRPLIRDAHSNVLDQETQLTPYRRNLQDPLCDSGMIPYTEPYQSMYQRRRLGALGMEYRPSSIRFAVGPDFSLGEDYQMMPLPDPDVIIEMPVLLDATYFEPENEAATDDTDSEYDAANEYFSEKGQESLGTSAYNDSQSDEENSEVKRRHNSRRRKEKRDAQLTAPSRSIKRKKLEHCDGSTSQNNPKKKLRNGHRPSRKKSSTAKTPRPQRVAAQNALNMFSKMPETPSGPEDEDDRSLSGSSDTETSFQYSDMQSDESDTKQLNKQHQNGKKPILDESVEVVEPVEPPRDEANVRNKRKLVLKLAIRDSQKTSLLGTGAHKSNSQDEFEPSSSIPHQEEDKLTSSRNEDPGLDETEEKPNQTINRLTIKYRPPDRAVDHPNTLENSEPRGSFGPSCSRSFDKECGDSGVENTAVGGDNYDELRENAQPVKTKIRIKSSGFSREEKTAKLKLVTKAENPGYRKDSSVLRTDAAGTDCMKEENVSDTSDSDPSFGVDFPEEETDAARRSRSIELKATSRDPDRVNGKLKVRKGERSMGTSKGLGSRSEEWISNSNVTVRSELTRQDNVYEDYLGLGLSHLGFAGTKISWLMLPEHEPGYRYIPQLGDVVAYLMQGHQEYQESNPSHEKGPWVTMKGKLNAVEICQIERLDYSTLPGSGESCCKITLKFIDPSSKVSGKSFRLTLPELSNFPDFLVEKTRYDAAIMRDWSPGEKCSVWWRNDSGEGGSWWEGWIVSAQAKSSEFPDSPWERYEVQYESEDGPQPHCPWELHDLDARWEHPHIDFDVRNKFLSYFSKLEQSVKRNQDYYGIQKLQQASQKMDFLNRFAVPMSPGVIQSRLEHNYYRSVEAVKHDIQVMISNAFQYFGRNSQHSVKIKRLDEFFQRKFLSL